MDDLTLLSSRDRETIPVRAYRADRRALHQIALNREAGTGHKPRLPDLIHEAVGLLARAGAQEGENHGADWTVRSPA